MSKNLKYEIEKDFEIIQNKKLYSRNLGNFVFNIYSSLPNIEISFNEIPPNENLKQNIIINIFIENDEQLRKKYLELFKNNHNNYFYPEELVYFYQTLNNKLVYQREITKHDNKYYKINDDIFAYFPYISDNFLFKYSRINNDLYIIGNNNNLNRIIEDFLSISRKILPLHASCVEKNNNAIGLISDSNGGKTSILIKLLEKGYNFVGDDSLFFEDYKAYRVNNTLCFRKRYPNNTVLEEISRNSKEEKIHVDVNKVSNKIGFGLSINKNPIQLINLGNTCKTLEEMRQPFPVIANHSFWCTQYITNNYSEYIDKLLAYSLLEGNVLLKKAKNIAIDFNNIDKTITKVINNLESNNMKKILISDYDDTLFTDESQIQSNINSINSFREKGNIFVIATARGINSIKKEIKKYNINCDYIISDLGAIVEKQNPDEIIYASYMNKEQVCSIKSVLEKYPDVNTFNFSVSDDNKDENKIIGYKLKSEKSEILDNIKLNLIDNNNDIIVKKSTKNKLFIANGKNSKKKSIDMLLSKLNISKNQVYTVGDSEDDLEMIKKYNGYRMENSTDLVKSEVHNSVKNINELINIISS